MQNASRDIQHEAQVKSTACWARRLAVVGLLFHTAIDLAFACLIHFTSNGMAQLGVYAILCFTFDAGWVVPLSKVHSWALDGWWELARRLCANEFYGRIILVSLPIGGAVYAGAGWLMGRALDRRRSNPGNRPSRLLQFAHLIPVILLLAVPIFRPIVEDLERVDGFTPESAARHYLHEHELFPETRLAEVSLTEISSQDIPRYTKLYLVKDNGVVLGCISVWPCLRIAWFGGSYEVAHSQPWAATQ